MGVVNASAEWDHPTGPRARARALHACVYVQRARARAHTVGGVTRGEPMGSHGSPRVLSLSADRPAGLLRRGMSPKSPKSVAELFSCKRTGRD